MSASSTNTKRSGRTWDLPRAGDVLAGKYRILGVLGKGGLAMVFSAMHATLEQRVAIKMLLPEWSDHPEIVARFVREGRSAIKIRSEHVVRVLDVDTAPSGAPYIVLEYLDGCDLEALVSREGPLAVPRAVDYVLQACEAMAEAHAQGVVHRDLKPANLFLTRLSDGSDCVKVLDFGISKEMSPRPSELDLTSPSIVMGSPHYMSPEQLTSTATVDERSDIWSLGTILYELLSGKPPFFGDTGPQICVNVMQETPVPLTATCPDIPEALEATVLLCLEKDPARRFANVGELALALAAFGTPETAHASADRTVRVLQGAGIIPVAQNSGLWIQPGPSPREPARHERPAQHAERAAARPAPEELEFHLHRRRPWLIVAACFVAFVGIGTGAFYYWWRDVEPWSNGTATVLTAAPPRARPAAALSASAAPPPPAASATQTASAPAASAPTATASAEPAPEPEPTVAQKGDPTRPTKALPPRNAARTTRAHHPPIPAPHPTYAPRPPVSVPSPPRADIAAPDTGGGTSSSTPSTSTPPAPTTTEPAAPDTSFPSAAPSAPPPPPNPDQLFDERK